MPDYQTVVRQTLEKVLGPAKAAAAMETSNMFEDGLVDSYGLFEIASQLEESCDIQIPTEYLNASDFGSVSGIAHLCQQLAKR